MFGDAGQDCFLFGPFGFEVGADLVHWAALLTFGVAMWRLSVWRMTRRLVL